MIQQLFRHPLGYLLLHPYKLHQHQEHHEAMCEWQSWIVSPDSQSEQVRVGIDEVLDLALQLDAHGLVDLHVEIDLDRLVGRLNPDGRRAGRQDSGAGRDKQDSLVGHIGGLLRVTWRE